MDLALAGRRHLRGVELGVLAVVFLGEAFGFFAGGRAADAVGYGRGSGFVDGGGLLIVGAALVAGREGLVGGSCAYV